jgi:hypothetical protein
MSDLRIFGVGSTSLWREEPDRTEHLVVQQPLRRVLAFTGRSIDQVINCPVAKREVLGFYKLYRQIERTSETIELERQWNPLGRAG